MLLAHGLFKAPLFLVTGTSTTPPAPATCAGSPGCGPSLRGTRDRRRCGGRVDGRAAAAARVRRQGGRRSRRSSPRTTCRGRLVDDRRSSRARCSPSAYSARFLWGAFARKPGVADTPVHRPGPAADVAGRAVRGRRARARHREPRRRRATPQSYAGAYPATSPEEAGYHLALWHGLGLPLLVVRRRARARATRCTAAAGRGRPARRPSSRARCRPSARYEIAVGGTERVATVGHRAAAGRLRARPTSPSSCVTVVALPGTARCSSGRVAGPARLPRAAAAAAGRGGDLAALALVRVRRRFTAVLLVGVIGYGVGGLFIVDGAPDLALAQFLVETLSLVAFVFVLRRMPAQFTRRAAERGGSQVPKAAASRRSRAGWSPAIAVVPQRRPPGAGDDQRRVRPARPRGRGCD